VLSGALALWLLRRNRNQAAFRVLCYGAWLATMIALSYSGGLYGNSALALPIIIVFSAWLAGIRAMLILGGATIVVLFGYAFLEMYGLLPVRAATPILQRAFIMSVIVLTATALGYFAARTLAEQMAALEASRGELEGKMAALARREQELSLLTERVPAMIAHSAAIASAASPTAPTPASSATRRNRSWAGTRRTSSARTPTRTSPPPSSASWAARAVRLTVSRSNAAGESRSLAVELVPDVGAAASSPAGMP
jgi:glucan phosphoethanolaminetransferase (alkaline phosphatase superfamily)